MNVKVDGISKKSEHHTAEWIDSCELREETVMEGTGIVGGLGRVSVRYSLITGEARIAPFSLPVLRRR